MTPDSAARVAPFGPFGKVAAQLQGTSGRVGGQLPEFVIDQLTMAKFCIIKTSRREQRKIAARSHCQAANAS